MKNRSFLSVFIPVHLWLNLCFEALHFAGRPGLRQTDAAHWLREGLGAMIPATGGPYVFLRESYGPLLAFLSGWTYFFIVISASVAWLAINFATYLGQFVTLSAFGSKAVALGLIALVTAANYRASGLAPPFRICSR